MEPDDLNEICIELDDLGDDDDGDDDDDELPVLETIGLKDVNDKCITNEDEGVCDINSVEATALDSDAKMESDDFNDKYIELNDFVAIKMFELESTDIGDDDELPVFETIGLEDVKYKCIKNEDDKAYGSNQVEVTLLDADGKTESDDLNEKWIELDNLAVTKVFDLGTLDIDFDDVSDELSLNGNIGPGVVDGKCIEVDVDEATDLDNTEGNEVDVTKGNALEIGEPIKLDDNWVVPTDDIETNELVIEESNELDVAKPVDLDNTKPVDNEFDDDDDEEEEEKVEAGNNKEDTKIDVFWEVASNDFEVSKTDDDDDVITVLDIEEVIGIVDVEGIGLDVNNVVELSDKEIENFNGETKIELALAIDEPDMLPLIVFASKWIVISTARMDRTIKKIWDCIYFR